MADSEAFGALCEPVKRIRGKKQPLSSGGLHALRDEYTCTIEPARALAAETLILGRTVKAKG